MSRAYGPGSYDAAYEKQGRDYPIATSDGRRTATWRSSSAWWPRNAWRSARSSRTSSLVDAAGGLRDDSEPRGRSLAVLLQYPAAEETVAAPAFPHGASRSGIRAARRRRLRVALVGAGNLARWVHLPIIQKARGVALRAVCSTSGARGLSYAERFGATYCCADYEELLGDPDVDRSSSSRATSITRRRPRPPSGPGSTCSSRSRWR
jgi:hypothetical protein